MGTEENQEQHQNQQQIEEDEDPILETKRRSNFQCFFFLGDLDGGKKILAFFQGVYYSIFITVITLITLFADDFRVIFFTAAEDIGFNYINLICMGFFFLQILVLSFLKENYFFGFYFWLDIISTVTMVLDLTWIKQLMSGGNGAVQTASTVAKVARASRASKVGAKATKLIRIIRLIRFLKLYKTASKQLVRQNGASGSSQKLKRMIRQPASKQTKISSGQIEPKITSKRWGRLKQDSSCKIIPVRAFNQNSLRNLMFQNSNNKISLKHIGLGNGVKENHLQIPHQNPQINHPDFIIESMKKIENAKKKRHNTENLKDMAGFQGYFRELQSFGSKGGEQSLHHIQDSSSSIDVPNETRVGAKIKDEIQKQLIIMILLIIICIPLFNSSTWFSSNITSYQKGIYELQTAALTSPQLYDQLDNYYIDFMMKLPSTLVYFSVNVNTTCCTFPDNYPELKLAYNVTSSEEYRMDDLLSYVTDAGSVVVFETTASSVLTSELNVGRTLFVCLILVVATLLFSRDLEIYALQPLQNMFDTVGRIALNPLGAIREIEEKRLCMEVIDEQLENQKAQLTEPIILENLIIKIGGLLAVGFGEAGTQIISKVIQDPEFVNVIIPGQKVMGIYGFCDIRNFTDATEILEADVMVFVNQIAEICHTIVNSHCGSPNKNIGDAFLLVWKYKEGDIKFEQNDGETKKLQLVETKRVKQLADLAVLSFVRMIAEISKSHTLLKYKNNKALKNRIKDYKGVKMGFGLHVGWSIEGPIGSEFKVDASYLSPSVNMASRLEAGTKEYGVPMLITEDVYKLMTENRHYLRQVDRVMFQGYNQPTNLYTVDLHPQTLIEYVGIQKEPTKTPKLKRYEKIRANIKRNKILEDIETKYVTKDMWEHKDIKMMREKFTLGFYQEWKKGFDLYLKGEWTDALQVFKRTKIMAPDQRDGPSEALIKFIEDCQGKAPEDWKGYRQATI